MFVLPQLNIYEPGDSRRIAYRHLPAARNNKAPGVVFLCGFRSDMSGGKAQHLYEWAKRTGRGCLLFDYTGHGESSGAFEDGTISDWTQDAEDIICTRTEGPQILVGSSMGGWISLLLAKRIPERIAGFVGIAAAPDFAVWGLPVRLGEAGMATLEREGRYAMPSQYSEEPTVITKAFLDDASSQSVLSQPISLPFPVRLLHGSADPDVPLEIALRLMEHARCEDLQLTIIKDAGHRLNEAENLALMLQAVESVTKACSG